VNSAGRISRSPACRTLPRASNAPIAASIGADPSSVVRKIGYPTVAVL
jgi:hypothetical protein